MKKLFTVLAISAMAMTASTGAFAKVSPAMEQAREIDACGGLKIISARFLESGRLEVTCPYGWATAGGAAGAGAAGIPNALAGLGLTTASAAAVGAGALLLIVVIGDDGSVSTTTTTTAVLN